MLAFIDSQDLALWCHHLDLKHLISSQAISSTQRAMSTSSQISSESHSSSATRHNREISYAGFIIDLEHLHTCCSSDSRSVNGLSASFWLEPIIKFETSHVM